MFLHALDHDFKSVFNQTVILRVNWDSLSQKGVGKKSAFASVIFVSERAKAVSSDSF